MNDALLEVDSLRTTFPGPGGRMPVVDDVSFRIARGEILALVGESGCGKTVTALSILRLVPRPGLIGPKSRVRLAGRDLLGLSVPEMRRIRGGEIAMIFQEPMTALNPVQRVGEQVVEAIRLHESITAREARARVEALFERVRIPDPRNRFDSYPHQLSGGLRQRVMIAMAIAMRPALLIADEPTTALDVTVQAQILALLRELQRDLDMSVLLITHDLGVVNELADRVAVMYAGRVVERGTRREIFREARHPYTQRLLRAIPALADPHDRLAEISGVVPSPEHWPAGCRFAPRCPRRFEPCDTRVPSEDSFTGTHTAACHAERADRAADGADAGQGGAESSGGRESAGSMKSGIA